MQQKDALIINLRSCSNNLTTDLNRSNDQVLSKQNLIVVLQNDVDYLKELNHNLVELSQKDNINNYVKNFYRFLTSKSFDFKRKFQLCK